MTRKGKEISKNDVPAGGIKNGVQQMTGRITPAELDEMEWLEKKIIPGPWLTKKVSGYFHPFVCAPDGSSFMMTKREAAFICAARNALPGLIAEVRELWEELMLKKMDALYYSARDENDDNHP
jgi:hypothetical protein